MSYGDYVEQLTYLLFLKMADERTKEPYNQPGIVPAELSWGSLIKRDGDDLFDHYRHLLEKLGNEKGLLALISGVWHNNHYNLSIPFLFSVFSLHTRLAG